ncbi:nicotinamidase-related amidase [Paenibacillus shirakamiensis]|uniref:Nicotinamidase-related amidase n=1 Tax=Paenibacillus shirakamiensis TaxID=1265935 RepID=A0ABS4JMQ7_9BACL|nr:cysteine hydrolase [Paenibacillus shirakamiensis]MBP2002286.1 nicotinamidase-related amidase [Paenibacillus shirakamiensis]
MSTYTKANWATSALFTIDMQIDFTLLDAPAHIPGTQEVIPQISNLLHAYRKANLPIIHVIRFYKEDGSNADMCRKEAIEQGKRIVVPYSQGSNLVPDLLPEGAPCLNPELLLSGEFQQIGHQEWVMYKPRWGAFYQTNLESFLKKQTIDTVVFSGCNFPNCPRTSIYEASERDFRIVMAQDAISGVYEKGITELSNIGVIIEKTSDITDKVTAAGFK